MPVGYYAAVIAELGRLGFAFGRQAKGSHEIWKHPDGRQLTVPFNLKSRHTANGILKDAGSTLKF